MPNQFRLNFKNDSANSGNILVFQTDPDEIQPNVYSLAWFSKFVHPTTGGHFDWNVEFNFMWSEPGMIRPGIRYEANQTVPANLVSANFVELFYRQGGYTFSDTSASEHPGILTIDSGPNVPLNEAVVGIGMSGSGTFVCNAQPNQFYKFTPKPKYWVAFGNNEVGEVVDIETINNAVEVAFPPNVFEMTATLELDNKWTIS